MFGRKQRRQAQQQHDQIEAALAEDRATMKQYVGGHAGEFLQQLDDVVEYDVDEEVNETLRLAATVIRCALDGKDFDDMYGDLRLGEVENPYHHVGRDLGWFLHMNNVTFRELVEFTVVVTDQASIVNFHDLAMLDYLASEPDFGDEKVEHVLASWQPMEFSQNLLEEKYGKRESRDVRFVTD